MSNYHFSFQPISRKAERSIAQCCSYITGKSLRDHRLDRLYVKSREDVMFSRIYLPDAAPAEFYDLQTLITAIDQAETRADARTGREIIASLPNELKNGDHIRIVENFITENITCHSLCAIAAIHKKSNIPDPSRDNPHVHIVISTRPLCEDGFCRRKDRERDRTAYLLHCREEWAKEVNLAYERSGFDTRVDHRSLREQGILREPQNHLPRKDWEREQRGEHTLAGDRRREIIARNAALERQTDRDFEKEPAR